LRARQLFGTWDGNEAHELSQSTETEVTMRATMLWLGVPLGIVIGLVLFGII
jgi:hypothetical protein